MDIPSYIVFPWYHMGDDHKELLTLYHVGDDQKGYSFCTIWAMTTTVLR